MKGRCIQCVLKTLSFEILWWSFHSRGIQIYVIFIVRNDGLVLCCASNNIICTRNVRYYPISIYFFVNFDVISLFLIEEVIQDWVGSNCDIWTRFELIFVRVWWATKTTSSFSFAFITSSALNLVERNIWQNVISKSKWATIYILNLRGTIYQ